MDGYLPIFNHNLCISNKLLDWCVINWVHDENIVYSRIFILFISLIFEIFGTNNLIVSRRWFIGSNVNDIESHSVSKDGFIIGILSFCYLSTLANFTSNMRNCIVAFCIIVLLRLAASPIWHYFNINISVKGILLYFVPRIVEFYVQIIYYIQIQRFRIVNVLYNLTYPLLG